MLNASLPRRSWQLVTWFTFHLGNRSGWKALSGQESTIGPSIPSGSWTPQFPCPILARILWGESGLPEDASWVERSGVWVESGLWLLPGSCTELLALPQASALPPLSPALRLAWVWPADVAARPCKTCTTKTMVGYSGVKLLIPYLF